MSCAGLLPELTSLLRQASTAAQQFVAAAREPVRARIAGTHGIDRALADAEQHIVHGFGWFASCAEMLNQVAGWVESLQARGELREIDALLAQLLFAEYAAQFTNGIAMSQGEMIRAEDLTHEFKILELLQHEALRRLRREGASQDVKMRIVQELLQASAAATLERSGLDTTLEMIREQFHAFGREQVLPHAHGWHLRDELIPLSLITRLGAMGVFGLTIPEAFGGSGMGKIAMWVVSEELSRAWLGVGSLATRSEIAAELILGSGTEAQQRYWLPRIASGQVLPTAVFTEPDTGSDLGALRTRAAPDEHGYLVTGAKTWITHAARSDLMTLLVRTDPSTRDHRGLSMLLAAKPRGDDSNPFPAAGMSGGEIGVIGYRGMKEYEIAFDGFRVAREHLLGGIEGLGFRQLMSTFESARIQTAARAAGVAQAALDAGLLYASQRRQFGRCIIEFPRVANKLALMAAEIMGVRQLGYFAARRKDRGQRCDLEAGMAKLIGARVAWSAADNALQIHGGNGFAQESPVSRLLADARILNIFEGAGEIQAQVIARRLLESSD